MADFVTIGKVAEFPDGKLRRFYVSGQQIGVVFFEGRWHAYFNRCTHNGFQMNLGYIEDGCLHCPIHYGVFDLETGKAKSGPVTDLPQYPIRVLGDDVQVIPEPVAQSD